MPRTPAWLPAVAAVVISGGAYFISTGLGNFWPAAWVAPLPVLVLAFRSTRRTATVGAIAAHFLGSLNLLAHFAVLLPVVIVVPLLLLPAVAFAGAMLAARHAVQRLPPWVAAFAFPAAWTSYEFLLSLVSPHGTALSLAYSQSAFLPLLQVASLTGIWGITFVLTLIPSAIAVAWTCRARSPLVPVLAPILAPALAILIVALGFGAVRLRHPPRGPVVRVGLAATDEGVAAAFDTEDPAVALAVARAYAERVARLADEGAQVVVLPEKFVGVTPADAAGVLLVLGDAARDARVTLIAGLNRVGISPPRNVAVVFAPDGRMIIQYQKHHLLPGPETGYAIGAGPGLFPAPAAQWGVAICKDMDFPAWLRGYGRRGVRILAVPAWDFVRDGRLHSRMAVVRGVENGFSIARVAQNGLLTFSDGYGRILAEAASDTIPEAMLVQDLRPGPGRTFYTRYGDWFGWSSVAGLAGLLAASRRPRSLSGKWRRPLKRARPADPGRPPG